MTVGPAPELPIRPVTVARRLLYVAAMTAISLVANAGTEAHARSTGDWLLFPLFLLFLPLIVLNKIVRAV